VLELDKAKLAAHPPPFPKSPQPECLSFAFLGLSAEASPPFCALAAGCIFGSTTWLLSSCPEGIGGEAEGLPVLRLLVSCLKEKEALPLGFPPAPPAKKPAR
jgi:hypothetical protein